MHLFPIDIGIISRETVDQIHPTIQPQPIHPLRPVIAPFHWRPNRRFASRPSRPHVLDHYWDESSVFCRAA